MTDLRTQLEEINRVVFEACGIDPELAKVERSTKAGVDFQCSGILKLIAKKKAEGIEFAPDAAQLIAQYIVDVHNQLNTPTNLE
jgi:hypothetical protein